MYRHLPAEVCSAGTGYPSDSFDFFSRSQSLGKVRTAQHFVTATIVQTRRDVLDPPALGTIGSGNYKLPGPLIPRINEASTEEYLGPIRDQCQTETFRRLQSVTSVSNSSESESKSWSSVFTVPDVLCQFQGGVFPVWVVPAQSKNVPRMTEKVQEYVKEGADWPRAACILDPVRVSIVCYGAAQIIEIAEWFLMGEPVSSQQSFPVCRVKNKFALSSSELVSFCPVLSVKYFPAELLG